ncbi:TRAP transporter substrate-binding protein DctP [Kaistia defluvii]|uniref:TRAP transporter substrate-binding protein n=1 Tax=Kaistia defluvii TaxID=410841 RepID=UPI0022595A31|nr:TRAP transporter substrate-binding protein DctP [Kaistia defluvii]MCX5517633.1 TRAP transporter substrate-binding protein DctP [Kaistia defluvii]
MSPNRPDRRSFLRNAVLAPGVAVAGGAAPALAAPAIASVPPAISWQLQSSFPASLETIHGTTEAMARSIAALTGGRFRIEIAAAGDYAPSPETLDAVRNGTIQAHQTCSYYYMDLDPAFAIGTALPFGLNARMQNAWITDGGGQQLLDAFYAQHDLVSFVVGNTGAQMGGWYRREIRSLPEIAGLKMRIAGLGGTVLARLGVEPQQLAPEAIYSALADGTIDAAEWGGPHEDEKFGFYKVAPYYYYPGWWEGGPSIHLLVNRPAFEALPESYRVALRTAAAQASHDMLARFDVRNNTAIRNLIDKGVQLRPFPSDLLEAAYKAAFELYGELSADHPSFKAIYEPWKIFRDQIYQTFRVAENSFDTFGFAQQAKGL